MPKYDGVFKVQFHNTNLALRMPKWVTKTLKWVTKMLKLATSCPIFVAKKTGVLHAKICTPIKNASDKAFLKLTPDGSGIIGIAVELVSSGKLVFRQPYARKIKGHGAC